MNASIATSKSGLSKPFWVIWGVELWERFGYYGVQAIIALYFVKQLGFTERESMYVFGAFAAFVYGFVWVGGYIGDKVLGAKRTVILGAVILMLSYAGLALANKETIYFALAGVVVGNALFKANPSSLISKMFAKGDSRLDGAMTLYYMAINVGSFISMSITPIVSKVYGWHIAFWICSFGLLLGLLNFVVFYSALKSLSTEAGRRGLNLVKLIVVILLSIVAIYVFGILLHHPSICFMIVYAVVFFGFAYFLWIAFQQNAPDRARMLIAFVLMIQAVIFFVLYNQMPTSLTFFAMNNVDNSLFGWTIPAAQYQVLNPFFIIVLSPLLAIFYRKVKSTHATKFCMGMTLCGLAFLVLYLPRFTAAAGLSSPWWLVLSYGLQSAGELLVSGLGLAMVAELCPAAFSGFVMGVWFLTTMLAGPISAKVGALTTVSADITLTTQESLNIYTNVFGGIGLAVLAVAAVMWLIRPVLNRYIATPNDPQNHTIIETMDPEHIK